MGASDLPHLKHTLMTLHSSFSLVKRSAFQRSKDHLVHLALAAGLVGLAGIARAQISISHLGTYATGSYNTAAAEIVSFDPVTDRIFFVNAQLKEVRALNASNPASLALAFTIPMGAYGGGANSVTVVPGGIAVAMQANTSTDPGSVVFFDANGVFLSQVTVGALPDHVSVTPNGQKVLVANEGEPNTAYTIDPLGTVSIIDISAGIASVTNANVTTLDFSAYTPAMIPGVRIFGPGASVAQDMEPEYIAVSDDSQKAFVTCQENNAVVRIDLATNTIEQITALGLKDHSLPGNGLDASDSPTGINIANWPVKGLYMPDAADAFTIGGQTYVAYANEGDAREYTPLNEPRRIGNAAYVLDPAVFPNAATLKLNANLGRLNASISSGNLDADPEFEEIHVFGSRSFTIRDANGAIVWDSGDQLEQITSAAFPTNFNCNNSANGTFDTRSDDKGPEPEAIAVANVYGSTYAFIGLERIGGIMVYDVSVPNAPVFVQYLNNRNFAGNAAAGTALDLGPEDIKFVSASDSPDGTPFLITGNEISGTVSTFRINPPPFELQILHASDFEGAVPATEDAPRFAAIVDSLEHTYTNSLTLSSGDNFLPGPFMSAGEDPSLVTPLKNAYINYYGGAFANNDLRAGIGRVDITILNLIGVQAATLGNHEFDLGTSELRNIIGGVNSGTNIRWFGAQFPYLSSNLNFSGDANLSSLYTATREQNTFFKSNPSMTAAAINATKKLAPSTIINVNGEEIGIVGATTQILASISSPGATTLIGPSVDDMPALAAILQPVIDSLIIAEGIDKIILMCHLQQLTLEKALAPLLSGVDVIIAGGSHTLMADATDRMRTGDVAAETYPFLTTGLDGKPIAIVNTTSEYKYVGRLVVDFNANGDLIPASIDPAISGAYPADSLGVVEVWGDYASAFTPGSKGQEVKNLCDAVKNVIIAKDGNLFGKTSVFLEGRRTSVRTEETNLGNITADANKWMARRYDPSVTISIKNGGGIRSAIGYVNAVGGNVTLEPPQANPLAGKAQGDISQLDIENSLRFNNQLSALTLTAASLRTILEHGVAASGPGQTQGRFPQISGVRFSYNETLPANARILNAVITDSTGATVDTLVQNGALYGNPSRTFRVVTLNFLAGGGDGYPFNTLGTGRVDLNTLPDAGPGMATFTNAGSEQDAFAEFMKSFHVASPYASAETPASADERIQEVNDRPDCILPPRFFADSDNDGFGDPNDFVTSCPGGAPSGYVSDATDDCPVLFGKVGDSCDDGSALTSGDVIENDCVCRGTCTGNEVALTLTTDGNALETSYNIVLTGTSTVVCAGTGFANSSVITTTCCLANGCYDLRVFDSAGDGIANPGGYVLRDAANNRIIDNDGNGATFISSSVSPLGFCVPLGTGALQAASCNVVNANPATVLRAVIDPAVTATYIPGHPNNANNGYQYWVTNPNGGFTRRILFTHAAPGSGWPAGTPAAQRATYFRLSAMSSPAAIPQGVLLNVRVRSLVSGTFGVFGPACRLLVPVPPCAISQLTTTADPLISCGATGLSLSSTIHATAVTGATGYQFEFSKAGYLRRITQPVRSTALNFVTSPLQNNNCYTVRVRATTDGGLTFCPFGPVCTITIGTATCGGSAMAPYSDEGTEDIAISSSLSIWPNPNDGSTLGLALAHFDPSLNAVTMDVTDVYGKLVESRIVPVQDGSLNTSIAFEHVLAPGLYLVHLQAGSERYTERLVIE